jgi:hypothetical protein
MFRHKTKKEHTAQDEAPKAGYMDRAVGTLKQMAGRAFDEPQLYAKGKNQAKFGSQVIVHDRPVERHRPWVGSRPSTESLTPSQPLVIPQPAPVIHVQQAPELHGANPTLISDHVGTLEPSYRVTTGQTVEDHELPRQNIPIVGDPAAPASSVASPFDQGPPSVPAEPVRTPTPQDKHHSRSRWF